MGHSRRRLILATALTLGAIAIAIAGGSQASRTATNSLRIQLDERRGTLSVYRAGRREAILTQHAPLDQRPYLDQMSAPDGGILSGLSSELTRAEGSWRRMSFSVNSRAGQEVGWQTAYNVEDASKNVVLAQTERWSVREENGRFLIDVEWRGTAKTDVPDVTLSSLFLRVPPARGAAAEIVNAARQRNERADGQRAMWIDVALRIDGHDAPAHVALFDHPDNRSYPQAWRVDRQSGIGAIKPADSDWTIKKGETETVRHRLVLYTGALNDVEMTAAWSNYSGNRSTYSTSALWTIAQREGRAERFLTGDQAAAAMTTMPGYAVKAWASEPAVEQPMAFCWDDRGRLWVAENRDYEARGRGFSNAGTSRIIILEDTDHDGVADSRKVFMEGIVFPTALAVGFGGVFVGAPPNLLFVPDRNGDDKADTADIEVRLTGWGISDRHEVMNSLTWGPDGWLYGLQGFATASKVRKPEGNARLYKPGESFPDVLQGDGIEINGGVWRYHATKDRFEVVAHGFSNPWGIDYDAKGQLVMTACVIPHLWHVVPGGIYQRQGGRHFNPYAYSDIQTIADHRHRSAHGGARVYQSDAFPQSQWGRVFMANIHEHAILSDVLERKGSGFTAHHGDDFVLANNAQWVGFSLEIGPDGALYVLDWHDADICGADVRHHETGRIFRIAPTESRAEAWPGRYSDLNKMTDAELVTLQKSRSDWHARRARVILHGRAARGTLVESTRTDLLRMFTTESNSDWRLRAMWALHVVGGWSPAALVNALADSDEYIRAWAIQLLCEDENAPPDAIEAFTRMARDDRSPVVRLYLASALQRLNHEARWKVAAELMMHAEDATDQNLPDLIWIGLEPLVAENPARASARAAQSGMPRLARFIARRSVDADTLEPIVDAVAQSSKMQLSMLEGMRDGLEGRLDVAPPAAWSSLLPKLKRSPDQKIARLADDVSRQFGDIEAAKQNLSAVASRTLPVDTRLKALRVLAAQRRPELIPVLPAALDDAALRLEAIRAIAAFDDAALGKLLLTRFSSLTDAEQAEAMQTLASRGRYGRMLTEALAGGSIPKRAVAPHIARQLQRVVGVRFVEVWGQVDQSAGEERAYARYRGLLNDTAMKAADATRGRGVFLRTCGPCHKMYGEGGTIGPDITGSNRANLEYLLFNVLNPNGEVQDAYRMVVITTRDGRTHVGSVASETERQISLRVVGGEPVTLNKADIQSRETTATSMMPQGLFDSLTDREVIDLVGYLRTVEPLKVP